MWRAWALSLPTSDIACAAAAVASGGFVIAWLSQTRATPHTVTTYGPPAEPTRGDPGHIVLLNPRANAAPSQAERFAAFVEAAGRSTASRDLERAGFTRDEMERFRLMLLDSGWAVWNSAGGAGGDRRQGWRLEASAADILEAMGNWIKMIHFFVPRRPTRYIIYHIPVIPRAWGVRCVACVGATHGQRAIHTDGVG